MPLSLSFLFREKISIVLIEWTLATCHLTFTSLPFLVSISFDSIFLYRHSHTYRHTHTRTLSLPPSLLLLLQVSATYSTVCPCVTLTQSLVSNMRYFSPFLLSPSLSLSRKQQSEFINQPLACSQHSMHIFTLPIISCVSLSLSLIFSFLLSLFLISSPSLHLIVTLSLSRKGEKKK